MMNLFSFSDYSSLIWFVPGLFMMWLWIRTPLFVTAWGKRVLLWLKMTILAILVLALMDPKIQTREIREQFTLVFGVDISESVDAASRDTAFRNIASYCTGLPANVEAKVLVFDGATVELSAAQVKAFPKNSPGDFQALVRECGKVLDSDLGEALNNCVKAIPNDRQGRVILYSDGRDTCQEAANALEHLAQKQVPIVTVPLGTNSSERDPRVIRAVFPEQAFVGEKIDVHVLVHQPVEGEATFEITGTDGSSEKRQVNLVEGLNTQSFSLQPGKMGGAVYTIKVGGLKAGSGSSQALASVQVKALPRVLLCDNSPEEGRFLKNALKAENIDFVEIWPASWPRNLSTEIRLYPVMILNNVPKSAFRDDDLKAIREAVKEGNGLLMTGGPNSFGLGEYTETPVEETLPVKMPRRTINQAIALVLVLDSSGSMAGQPWNFLIEATKEILRLCRGHYVGVIMFNHFPTWVVPIQQITDPEATAQILDGYEAGGGTLFSIPLVQALVGLRDLPFSRKHVIFMSDGVPADFGHVIPLLQNFRDYKIPITTIAAGIDVKGENLKIMADETGGQYYESMEFSELPSIFRTEFKRISGPPFIEESFQPVLSDNRTLARGVTQKEIPAIGGLVVTQLKERASLILASNRGDPVLAFWRFGLGRSAAFTPDLLPNWTRSWAKWDGFGKLLRQTIKELSEGARERYSLFATQKGSRVQITVDPGLENSVPFSHIQLTDPKGQVRTLPLNPSSDARYQASFDGKLPGVYAAKVFVQGPTLLGETLLPVNESSELLPGKTNQALLKLIAEKTGGEYLESPDDIPPLGFEGGGETAVFISFWPLLAILALMLYLVDIFLRKANVFGIHDRLQLKDDTVGSGSSEIFLQLAQKFSNMAEEHSMRGEVAEAKRYYLRAKAFFMKAQATKEANAMWERYKRFEGH